MIDLHQDLMSHIRFRDKFGQSVQTDFTLLEESDFDLVVATAYPLPKSDDQRDPIVTDLITEELDLYNDFIKENQHWSVLTKAENLSQEGKKLLLHLEGLNVFEGSDADWEQLDAWHRLGVRSVGTHWNINNQLGGGTLDTSESLSSLGKEVIKYLEDKKIIFDMAHMGRQTFWDATKITKRPLYISHGNADAICSNVRNYTDDQLQVVAKSDGVVGVFFSSKFVIGKDNGAQISDVINHVDHMKKIMGIRHIAIGSDFGGITTGLVSGLESVACFENLISALQEFGYSGEEMEMIMHKNAERVLKAHLG